MASCALLATSHSSIVPYSGSKANNWPSGEKAAASTRFRAGKVAMALAADTDMSHNLTFEISE